MADPQVVYGLAATFDAPGRVMEAARAAYASGYRNVEAYTPFPVEGLAEIFHRPPTRVPLIALVGAIVGGTGAYFMMWYASVVSYPLNIGGKPTHSWPAFIPITFELTILCAAFSAVGAVFVLSGLPVLFHPLFRAAAFRRVSRDRFVLCVEAIDPKFDMAACRQMFRDSGCRAVFEVPKR